MVRITKDLFPPPRRRRSDNGGLPLWATFWFCVAMFLLGIVFAPVWDDMKFPFDIHLEGTP